MRGADRVEVQFLSETPLGPMEVDVRSFARHNRVNLRFGHGEETLDATTSPMGKRITLDPGEPQQVLTREGGKILVYRMVVETTNGAVRQWTRTYPPNRCSYFAFPESLEQNFFVGAEVTLLGTSEELAADVFDLRWEAVSAPESAEASSTFRVPVEVRNSSSAAWNSQALAPVLLSYHWLNADGELVERDGLRTPFPEVVGAGALGRVSIEVRAPGTPGDYVLELDPVFEHVSWFSEQDPDLTSRHPIRVVRAGEAQ